MIRNPKSPGKLRRRKFAHSNYIGLENQRLTNNCLEYFRRFEYRNPTIPLRVEPDFGDFTKTRHLLRNQFLPYPEEDGPLYLNWFLSVFYEEQRNNFIKRFGGTCPENKLQRTIANLNILEQIEKAELEDVFREGLSIRNQVTRPERYPSKL